MPTQPPRFGRPAAPRKAWAQPGQNAHKRIRGRAGVKLRRAVLSEEPLCRTCWAAGLAVAAEQVDHIVPLARGGSNARSNLQALCKPCHAAKSATERD